MSHVRKSFLLMLFSLCVLAGIARAADPPRAEVAADYSYVRGDAANGQGLNLNGADVSLAFRVASAFSVVGDVGANRTGNVCGSGLGVTISTFMAGPRMSLVPSGRFQPSVQLLLGAARASGSIFSAIGSTTGFAVAPGLRLDYTLSSHISLRLLEADYRFSTYRQDDSNREKSVRLGAGIVGRF
jgi:hypothetical protein